MQLVDESAARATANQWIARSQERSDPDSPFLFRGFSPSDPEAARAWVRGLIKTFALSHDWKMDDMCALARGGWDEVDHALRELINEYTESGERMPLPLRAYARELLNPNRLRPHRLKGQKKITHLLQDILIAGLVGELMQQHGLKATRSQKTQSASPSACSVVAETLNAAGIRNIGEKSVERIWMKYWPAIRPTVPRSARHG